MAVQPFTILMDTPKVRLVKWVLANGDTGRPIPGYQYSDQTFQLYGTFGATGSVQAEGSNDQAAAAASFTLLKDATGGSTALTAAGIKQILEHTFWIRPNCTAGDGTTSLTVIMCLSTTR
jgi:hypothetical protein